MFTKTKPYGYLVRIIIYGTYYMTPLIGAAGAGATATGTNIIDIQVK